MQLTIKEALDAIDDEETASMGYLYVYRDKEVVFYVGKSVHPFERLQEHIGKGSRGMPLPDRIGQLIIDNLPASLAWTMEVISIEEVQTSPVKSNIDAVESDLIIKLKPCLNRMFGRYPARLPVRYIKKTYANDGVIITE